MLSLYLSSICLFSCLFRMQRQLPGLDLRIELVFMRVAGHNLVSHSFVAPQNTHGKKMEPRAELTQTLQDGICVLSSGIFFAWDNHSPPDSQFGSLQLPQLSCQDDFSDSQNWEQKFLSFKLSLPSNYLNWEKRGKRAGWKGEAPGPACSSRAVFHSRMALGFHLICCFKVQ